MSEISLEIQRWHGANDLQPATDVVAEEAPLQIRVEGKDMAVVMRTPGEDRALVAGFLLTEGIIRQPSDIFEISTCPSSAGTGGNVVDVVLRHPESFAAEKFSRHVFTSSSCGICGKATLASVLGETPRRLGNENSDTGAPLAISPTLLRLLATLPEKQRAAQATFLRTGGLHASALFDLQGNLLALHEDVGRHNALDKLLGTQLLTGNWPLRETILLLSGRVSFELMQKAYTAEIPIVAAIGAPSSLAVDFAVASGQHLVGFLKESRANVYA